MSYLARASNPVASGFAVPRSAAQLVWGAVGALAGWFGVGAESTGHGQCCSSRAPCTGSCLRAALCFMCSPNPCVISSHGIFVALPVLSLKVV